MLDIGTGDGAFVYRYAKQNPSALVIGIDPCHENLIDISSKVLKKPSKGGLPNALFVLASSENLSHELNKKVDHIYINFPWGTLLQAIVAPNALFWNSLKRICKKNASIEVTFGYNANYDSKEIERLKLPILSESYLHTILIPQLEAFEFKVQSLKVLTSQDLNQFPTTWSKKLRYGQERCYYQLILKYKY